MFNLFRRAKPQGISEEVASILFSEAKFETDAQRQKALKDAHAKQVRKEQKQIARMFAHANTIHANS